MICGWFICGCLSASGLWIPGETERHGGRFSLILSGLSHLRLLWYGESRELTFVSEILNASLRFAFDGYTWRRG